MENQTTVNYNIPIRFLLYVTRIYERIIDNKAIYRKKLVRIPKPEFIVLYNGVEKCPDYQEMKLSDSFMEFGGAALELTVKMYNVNQAHNENILRKSKTLNEYIFFISRVRRNTQEIGMTLTDAIKEAVEYCAEHDIMKDYLEKYGSEVISMLFTEFSLEDAIEIAKEEAREDGIEEGRKKGREEGREEGAIERALRVARKALQKNVPMEMIIELSELSRNEIEKLKEQIAGE